jgi:hypothetical protein
VVSGEPDAGAFLIAQALPSAQLQRRIALSVKLETRVSIWKRGASTPSRACPRSMNG